jgi:hypothetical protein
VKNTECTIYVTTKRGWTQTSPNGIVRQFSAEQLLSHILPVHAAGNQGRLSARVEPDKV